MRQSRRVIAIDYDGTISDTNREKVNWIKAHVGRDISRWECSRTDCVPLVGLEAYEKMAAVVYERESTLQAVEVPGAGEALRHLAQQAELHVVTARLESRVPYAREWLERQGLWSCFRGIHTSADSSKAAICAALGAHILIDDDIRHLRNVAVEGLRRILLQDGREARPDTGPGIVFCSRWSDVLAAIESPETPPGTPPAASRDS